jgi:hypothetical protein
MTTPHDLPPLPVKSILGSTEKWFGQAQMLDYASAAIAPYKAEIERMKETERKFGLHQEGLFKRAEKADAENAKLRELLQDAVSAWKRGADPNYSEIIDRANAALGEKP